MNARDVFRALRTARHLLPEQIAAQLFHMLRGRVTPVELQGEAPDLAIDRAAAEFLPAPRHARGDGRRVELINRPVDFEQQIDWDFSQEGMLWSFHLHQFDWLRQPALSPALRTAQLLDWLERHPRGIGWRPHAISLRILSWGKLLLTPGALELDAMAGAQIRYSLACQAATLARNPERRLQANHLLSNWLGVVFAGLLFEGSLADAWLGRADSLRRELDRQIGEDGSHVERSPMYHSLLLENLLDLLNLARAASAPRQEEPEPASPARSSRAQLAAGLADDLKACTSRMLGALELWTHPDGEIALFADSALGIAHPPAALRAYARSLGVEPAAPRRAGLLADTGFVRLEAGPFVLLASVAGPMPSYMPGHSHCDALSFELSIAGERVVTDTGVGEYTPGPDRMVCRETRSHATLEVAGMEQAEIWGPHRIGGRPRVVLHAADPPASAEASCLGWGAEGARHRRVFEVDAEAVTIRDSLEGGARPARIAFPLAPGLTPELEAASGTGGVARARIPLAGGAQLEISLEPDGPSRSSGELRWTVERAPYFPEFGKRIERSVLVGESSAFGAGRWTFKLVREPMVREPT